MELDAWTKALFAKISNDGNLLFSFDTFTQKNSTLSSFFTPNSTYEINKFPEIYTKRKMSLFKIKRHIFKTINLGIVESQTLPQLVGQNLTIYVNKL